MNRQKLVNIILFSFLIISLLLITPMISEAKEISGKIKDKTEITALDKIAKEHDYNDVNGYYVLTKQELKDVKTNKSVNLIDHYSTVDITTYYNDGYIWGSIPYFTTSDG